MQHAVGSDRTGAEHHRLEPAVGPESVERERAREELHGGRREQLRVGILAEERVAGRRARRPARPTCRFCARASIDERSAASSTRPFGVVAWIAVRAAGAAASSSPSRAPRRASSWSPAFSGPPISARTAAYCRERRRAAGRGSAMREGRAGSVGSRRSHLEDDVAAGQGPQDHDTKTAQSRSRTPATRCAGRATAGTLASYTTACTGVGVPRKSTFQTV